jgi:hypothetical protein
MVQESFLSLNKNAIMILEHHTEKIYLWDVCLERCRIMLTKDRCAPPLGSLYHMHPDFFLVVSISWNEMNWVWLKKHPEVLEKLLSRIVGNREEAFFYLSSKPECLFIFEKYPHLIQWHGLSRNHLAIHRLLSNQEKIDWRHIYYNCRASAIFELYPNNINWKRLVGCHGTAHLLFPLNTRSARGRIDKDELIAYIYNPDRILASVNGNKELFRWKLSHVERACCFSDESAFVYKSFAQESFGTKPQRVTARALRAFLFSEYWLQKLAQKSQLGIAEQSHVLRQALSLENE